MSRIAAPNGRLLIFDYAVRSTNEAARAFAVGYQGSLWQPLEYDRLEQLFDSTGWTIVSCRDISAEYRRWYDRLLEQIRAKENDVIERAGRPWFDHILHKFSKLAAAVSAGTIAGITIAAQAETQ